MSCVPQMKHRALGRLDQPRVVGEAEVVVRAEIEHLAAAHLDRRPLRRADDTLLLVKSRGLDRRQLLLQIRFDFSVHDPSFLKVSRIVAAKRRMRTAETARSAAPEGDSPPPAAAADPLAKVVFFYQILRFRPIFSPKRLRFVTRIPRGGRFSGGKGPLVPRKPRPERRS